MTLIRPVLLNSGVYRRHEITEIRHMAGTSTRVVVRSFEGENGGCYMERRFDRALDDAFSFADAYAWIAELPDFAEHVDERDELISELAPTLTDEQAARVPWAYDRWAADASYAANDRVSYEGSVYRCLQAHDAQEAWTPADAPSLWANVRQQPVEAGDGGGEADAPGYGAWAQPDSTDPYMTGDRVEFEGAVYESTIDNNVWSPADYPAGWSLVA